MDSRTNQLLEQMARNLDNYNHASESIASSTKEIANSTKVLNEVVIKGFTKNEEQHKDMFGELKRSNDILDKNTKANNKRQDKLINGLLTILGSTIAAVLGFKAWGII